MKKTGLYIHIPFCVKKCNYCAFLSFDTQTLPRKEYTDALCNEIRLRAAAMRNDPNLPCMAGAINCSSVSCVTDASSCSSTTESAERIALDTVYIGGGTPSVLDVSQMRDIMHAVKTSFDIKPDAEFTIEVNPGTLGIKDGMIKAKLIEYKSMGFNRLSMGVQSMDNDTLHFLGRIHTAENIARDVRLIREAGFDNMNLDLIFSIPHVYAEKDAKQTEGINCAEEKKAVAIRPLERALEDARKIIALEPEHISCYSLQIEEGTPFAEMTERGEITEVPDEEDRDTYHAICRLLKEAGYEHYEFSNFAKMPDGVKVQGFQSDAATREDEVKSPYRSRHNSSYWDMSEYIGAGLGASGFVNGTRYKNVSDPDKYIEAYSSGSAAYTIGKKRADVEFPYEDEHLNDAFDNISEAVFTGLRRREGISYEEAVSSYRRCKDTKYTAEHSVHKISDTANKALLSDVNVDNRSSKEVFWDVFSDALKETEVFADKGLLVIDDDGIRLTEQGIDISNSIMALFV